MRCAFSTSVLSESIFSCAMRTWSMTAFSLRHCAMRPDDCSFRFACSSFTFSNRASEDLSFSFSSAFFSISSCMICRSSTSISVGIESSSIFKREDASSIRSTALSGRKRSEM